MKGRIYLIPVTLGSDDFSAVIPEEVIEITRRLRHFIVEDIRSARRYLRLIDRGFPVDSSFFHILNEHTPESETGDFLKPLSEGHDMGLMSEAGLPGIADPGSRLIFMAHRNNIAVKPLSGPSSIVMALIASGLNGQNFTFHGYLPVRQPQRALRLKEIERRSGEGYAQIFMETPYRNRQMMETIVSECHDDTMLCIAADISLPGELIKTRRISEWKKNIPDLNNRLVIFILQSGKF